MTKRTAMIILPGLMVLFASCHHSEINGGTPGPCIHQYGEAILHVQVVTDLGTGTAIPTVRFSDFMIDSTAVGLRDLIIVSNRVAMLDSVLIGNPPCSFGFNPGRYSFRLSASGYRDTMTTVDAAYNIFQGGCPSFSTEGTRIDLAMEPE